MNSMTDSGSKGSTPRSGRPRQARVTEALFSAALGELAEKGLEKTTIAGIAARARTSKQAIYRRYPDKGMLITAAIATSFDAAAPPSPQRASVAEDLRQFLTHMAVTLQEPPLGAAIKAILAHNARPPFNEVLSGLETSHRLALRQILIATPFEADMETRIDLLAGLIHYKLLIRNQPVTSDDIERAIFLVLGLLPPRDPGSASGFPGV